jgi:hypothetical protein
LGYITHSREGCKPPSGGVSFPSAGRLRRLRSSGPPSKLPCTRVLSVIGDRREPLRRAWRGHSVDFGLASGVGALPERDRDPQLQHKFARGNFGSKQRVERRLAPPYSWLADGGAGVGEMTATTHRARRVARSARGPEGPAAPPRRLPERTGRRRRPLRHRTGPDTKRIHEPSCREGAAKGYCRHVAVSLQPTTEQGGTGRHQPGRTRGRDFPVQAAKVAYRLGFGKTASSGSNSVGDAFRVTARRSSQWAVGALLIWASGGWLRVPSRL